jgi:uncharacterized protein (TIGR03000 family)
MCRQMFSFGGTLLLAGAALLATPGSGWAQRGGGGHFGGAHFGGAHFGGAHFGGAHLGGVHGGGFHFNHPHTFSYPHYGYHHYYRPFYGSYGYSYPSYGYSYPSYNAYPDIWSGLTDDPGMPSYTDTGTPSAGGYESFYPPATAEGDNSVHIQVNVPTNARVWFDGVLTTSTGTVREYQSAPVTPGQRYTYQIRARWNENGQERTQTQQVEVTAGAHVNVRFPVPPTAAGSAAQ